jgi:hypothetical protein
VDLAVEVDHLHRILGLQPLRKTDGRLLRGREPLVHAGAGVEENGKRDWLLPAREERQRLQGAVLEDLEVVLREVGDVLRPVHDRNVQGDQLDSTAEHLRLRRLLRLPWRGLCGGHLLMPRDADPSGEEQ